MAVDLSPQEKGVFRIVQAIRQILEGRNNATLTVTLTPGTTTTVVAAINCGKDAQVFLSPRTANAAAAVPTTYISAVNSGSFTVTHANNAQTDRLFGVAGLG